MLLVRLSRHWFFVKLFCILFLVATRTSENDQVNECPSDVQDDITWPRTLEKRCSSSEPICLNNKQEISKRCCLEDEKWATVPVCASIQQIIENPCPESSIRKDNICLFAFNSTFPPNCPYEEHLDFDSYIKHIENDMLPIWLPVEKKHSIYGEDLFYWQEKSDKYMTVFKRPFNYDRTLPNKSCLLYQSDVSIKTANCSEFHTAICAYNVITDRNKTFCSQYFGSSCKQSDYPSTSSCFCNEDQTGKVSNKIELLIPYQNLLFRYLEDTCYIGLEKRYDSYIWTNSNTSTNYTYWSRDANFGENYLYGAISAEGWILTSNEQVKNCSFIEKTPPDEGGEIILTYDDVTFTFTVIVENISMWKQEQDSNYPFVSCFTDCSTQRIIKKLVIERGNFENSTSSFFFSALDDGPGNYWCEGFIYPTLKVKKSNIYFLRPLYEEFVIPLVHVFSEETNPWSEEYLKYTQELLTANLLENLPDTTLYPRIFGIIDVDLKTSTAQLNFHFTTKSFVQMYPTHISLLSLNLKDFSFSTVLTFSSCIGGRTTNSDGEQITWTTTQYGNTLYKPSEGWCIHEDGSAVTRTCKGNFIDGANWSELYQHNCSLNWKQISPTLILQQTLTTEHPQMYLSLVSLQVQRITEIQVEDVNLVARYLKVLALQDEKINITELSILMDATLKIPQSVLEQSQDVYKSTEEILKNFIKILEKTDYIGTIMNESLSITSFAIDTFYSNSIIWRKSNTTYTVDFYNVTDREALAEEEFDSGLIFNPEIMKDIISTTNNNSRIIIIAYFKPSLFNEHFTRDYKSIIFSAIFLNLNLSYIAQIDNLIVTVYNNDFNSSCSYWHEGLWVHKTTNDTIDSKILCGFKNTINVGLVSTTNVTSLLELLQDDGSCLDSLSKALTYLNHYLTLFQPIDVQLVYKLLDKCKDQNDCQLHMNIIDKLLDLPVHVIQTARTDYDANLLQTFERILEGYNRECSLTKLKNFLVIIHDLSEKNLTGLYILCDTHNCSVNVMNDYSKIPEESEMYFLLDEQLLDQLIFTKISKIIITLFANDAFFLTRKEYDEKSFSKVIGISIPALIDDLKGNVSVTYKIHAEVVNKTCECWDEFGSGWNQSYPGQSLANDVYRCTFPKTSYYVLSFENLNVTKLLDNLLHSQENNTYILEGIQNITGEYPDKLEAIDVSLIANFFRKIENVEDLDAHALNCSVQIVNNLMHLATYIIQQAESYYFASSHIMSFFKKQLNQLKQSQLFCGSGIIILVSFFNEMKISGIEINNNQNLCDFTIIETQSEDNSNRNTSGIMLSEEIVSQISKLDVSTQKVVLVAFYSDIFFYDGSFGNNKNNVITFGVQIPDYVDYNLYNEITVFFTNITYDLDTVCCVSWESYDPENIADGYWDLPKKLSENYSCTFFHEGWYTLWTQGRQINVTMMLEEIEDNSISRKLNQLEAVTTFYDLFSPYDIFLMLKKLITCTDLPNEENTLLILKRIIINFYNIPKTVKETAQSLYKTNTIMLNVIFKIATLVEPYSNLNIGNYLQISAYNLNESCNIVVTDERINCRNNCSISLDYSQSIMVKEEILTITVFKNYELFATSKDYNTADIIHLSLDKDYNQVNTFTIKFNQQKIQKLEFSCACGLDFGKWLYFKTVRNEFLTVCKIPNLVTCSYVSLVNLSIHDILDGIYSESEIGNKLLLLGDVLDYYRDRLEISHIEIVYEILNACAIENDQDLRNLAAIVDVIMDLDRNILASGRDNFTEELHDCIERLVKQFKGETQILDYVNFAIIIGSNITGVIFEGTKSSMYAVKEVLNDRSNMLYTSDVTLIISKSSDEEEQVTNDHSNMYLTVYFNDALFIGRLNLDSKKYGIIVGLDFSNDSLGEHMKIYFDNYQNVTNVCAYWNHQLIDTNIVTWYWHTVNQTLCESKKEVKYFAVLEYYNVTGLLDDIFKSNDSTEDKLQDVIGIIIESSDQLKPVDIQLIADIMGEMLNNTVTTKEHVNLSSCIVSALYVVDDKVLSTAQQMYSSTDNILYAVDEMLKQCQDTFVEPIIYDNFTVIKTDIKSGNITGLSLKECTNATCEITFLTNQSHAEIFSRETNLFIKFSDQLMQQIVEKENSVSLIVTVHFHNNFFTESSKKNLHTSKVVGIILDGINTQLLPGPIFITYLVDNNEHYENSSCSFWKYKIHNLKGSWQRDSLAINFEKNYLTCEYDHLTHFVLLLASSSSTIDYLNSSHILDILTNINSILSLLGLFGILLTAVLFDRWRNNTGNQILINFTIAVSIKNVMLYISDGVYFENKTSMACTITGGILHYSILSEFCWMLIIAIIQFKRFVEVLGGPLKYVLLKACICGWVFPSLPVFLIIIIDVNNYNTSNVGLCYPSGFGLYLGVWLPLIVIITINFVIFVFILYNVFHKKTECRNQVNHEIIFQWRLALLLFSMLGLTWVFGFLALVTATPMFAVIFCFMATLQGFIMFLFFIVLNKNTRYMYIQGFSWWMYSKGYRLH